MSNIYDNYSFERVHVPVKFRKIIVNYSQEFSTDEIHDTFGLNFDDFENCNDLVDALSVCEFFDIDKNIGLKFTIYKDIVDIEFGTTDAMFTIRYIRKDNGISFYWDEI